jgi:hypothetical protein
LGKLGTEWTNQEKMGEICEDGGVKDKRKLRRKRNMKSIWVITKHGREMHEEN